MLRTEITHLIESAVARLIDQGKLPEAVRDVRIEVSDTKSPEHGDYACNFAMVATKKAGLNPRQIGEMLSSELRSEVRGPRSEEVFEAIQIAGPGFLNMRLKPEAISRYVPRILELGSNLPQTSDLGPQTSRKRVNVEFVSVNPNGPITVGSGRGAAFGDALSRVLRAAGLDVTKEYYINDGVNSEQMRLFAESVRHYYKQSLGVDSEFPEKGYKGIYVTEVATEVRRIYGDGRENEPTRWFQQVSQELMLERQRQDLEHFGVKFDVWFSEQLLHDEGKVEAALTKLKTLDSAYYAAKAADADEDPEAELIREESEFPAPGKAGLETGGPREALWLRSSAFGDDKDRVLVRGNGRPAYIAADAAYLENKLGERAFDKAFLILGPDHHGYIGRMYAACKALGYNQEERFEIVIFQIVRFLKDGKPAPMRKRDGNIYELRDLIDELGQAVAPKATKEEQLIKGRDVARFFYLMRSHDTHMDFDIDLATKQSDENPVFYVQYAHARICSVIAKAEAEGLSAFRSSGVEEDRDTATPQNFKTAALQHPRELALIKKILDLPFEVERCAKDYGVHRLTTYAVELARTYHHFYDACRVIQKDEPELSMARLALCQAARIGLQATLDLLGVSAPERMERAEEVMEVTD